MTLKLVALSGIEPCCSTHYYTRQQPAFSEIEVQAAFECMFAGWAIESAVVLKMVDYICLKIWRISISNATTVNKIRLLCQKSVSSSLILLVFAGFSAVTT